MTDQMKQVLEKDKNQLYLDDYCYIDLSDYDIDISDRANEWIGDRLEDAAKHFFDKGANSYRNNVWHDASKEPLPPGRIIIEELFGMVSIGWTTDDQKGIEDESGTLITKEVRRWAYLEDLLPDTKGGES